MLFSLLQLNTSQGSQGRSVEQLIDAFKSIETTCPGFSDNFVEKVVENVKRSKRSVPVTIFYHPTGVSKPRMREWDASRYLRDSLFMRMSLILLQLAMRVLLLEIAVYGWVTLAYMQTSRGKENRRCLRVGYM